MSIFLFNDNWKFKEQGAKAFETVTLPHTVAIEPLHVSKNKMGIFEYRKTFSVPKQFKNQRVFLHFEGAMTNCKVYVNNKILLEHFGGYLPFSVDMTEALADDGENEVFVLLDNHDDKDTPPGKPTEGLDFLYYGGIYRNVYLDIKPPIYLKDAAEHGGVRIDTKLQDGKARILALERIQNTAEEKEVTLQFSLLDGKTVLSETSETVLAKGENALSAEFLLEEPKLWDTEHPHLYTLKSELFYNGKLWDTRFTDFGIREVSVCEEGFFLNGKKTKLFGVNRGQQFPYLGIAASDAAQRREARMLKESGVNCLRLAHYPQSPAFISECDKLGILVIDPVPGWQFLGGSVWKERLEENLRELVWRDRNHASVVIFEVTPNETNWSTKKGDLFLHHLHEIVKEECSSALTGGDNVGRRNALRAGFDIPYYGKDGRGPLSKLLHPDKRLTLKREYGDWCFGGNASTSRVARGDGEKAMQVQTWNFQFDHNRTYAEGGIIGDLIWEGIDHNRGYFPDAPISKSGIFDIFRIPKLSYQFVRSQKSATSDTDFVIFMQALRFHGKSKLVFYSNCERLELYGDGKFLCDAHCDSGADKLFDAKKSKEINDNYWMTDEDHIETSQKPCLLAKHTISCLFDGGNCRHIDFPPFTFMHLQLDGIETLTVQGYADEKLVKKVEFKDAKSAVRLKIEPQTQNLPLLANDNDFIFVYVSAVDANGIVDTTYSDKITLEAENGSLIGHETISAEIGTAAFMVKANQHAKELILTSQAFNLEGSTYTLPLSE